MKYIIFFIIIHIVACSREVVDDPSSKQIENKVNNQEEYEENAGDFKRPAAILQKFWKPGNGFFHALIASFSVIIVSELGDKTFFIAAIMAMRYSRVTVLLGAMSALTIMTILSACLGFAITVIPRMYTHYISTVLFVIFGLKMLKEGYDMSPNEGQEEYEEVQKSVSKQENEYENDPTGSDIETGIVTPTRIKTFKRKLMVFVSRIYLESFTMTFLAEWGDRSQLTTIILAAREDAYGVTLGAIIGHSMCTLLAVVGGRIVAQKISVRSVTLIGGIVFLIFAVSALLMGPGS
ncbi:transmembrane protein 165-like [Centruroides sculpturatus]|uniref:transmembrane protein 165-like n=1 Tax=Centruroides sculpturatus TaxID=218467 RepID=UPI000C6E6E30|nr:transmembrane protein 165-like [Centruroides sculpturatus]